MKKTFKSMFVFIVVLGLAALVFNPAYARRDEPQAMREPMVSPMNVGDTYTTSIVEVGYLKGAVQKEDQSMAPVGRLDEQFGSNGLVVSDLTGKEKVKICFYFSGYNYKWAGNVYKWTGTQWVKQVTTIANDPAATPLACGSGLGNGTYALIIYYWGPQEMPAYSAPF